VQPLTKKTVQPLTKNRLLDLGVLLSLTILPPLVRSTYYAFAGYTPSSSSGGGIFIELYSALEDLCSILLLLYILFVRGRSVRDLGWNLSWLDFFMGVALAFGAYTLGATCQGMAKLISPASAAHFMAAKNIGFMNAHALWSLLLIALINPFSEELIVRGYLMTEIKALTGSKTRAVLASVLVQISYHFYQGAGAVGLLTVIFLLYAIFYAGTGKLAPVIIAHLIMDVIATLQLHH
jgi:membrane protease YdiL (CAAX protease family)